MFKLQFFLWNGGSTLSGLVFNFNLLRCLPRPNSLIPPNEPLDNFFFKRWLCSLPYYVSFSGFLSFLFHLWLKLKPWSGRYQLWTRVCSTIVFLISLTQVSYQFKCCYLTLVLQNLIRSYKMIPAACNNYSAIHLILAIPLTGSFGASLRHQNHLFFFLFLRLQYFNL